MRPKLPIHWLLLAVLGIALLPLPLLASETLSAAANLQANFIFHLVADRARLVQVSLIAVVLGCSLLWWRR